MPDILDALASGEAYRRLFEDSGEGLLFTDVEGRIVAVNRAWLALYGYEEREVLGQTTRLVKSELTTRDVYEHMWGRIRDPEQGYWKGEIVNRRKDGTEVPVLLTISPLRFAGELVGYAGISVDISERKRFEEFKRLYDLVVWHDLRSPLNAIVGMLDMMRVGLVGELSEQQKDLVARMSRQARRQLDLISTALDLEKLRERKLQLDLQPVELFAALREALGSMAELAGLRNMRLELRAGDRPAGEQDRLERELDPLHLQRCLDNLVKNAVEAAPRESLVWASVDEHDGRARIRVYNGGAPIPPDVRATLFHPFGTYGKRGGTGLGLYGVKMAVEAMGGEVRYESDDGGTLFTLLF